MLMTGDTEWIGPSGVRLVPSHVVSPVHLIVCSVPPAALSQYNCQGLFLEFCQLSQTNQR